MGGKHTGILLTALHIVVRLGSLAEAVIHGGHRPGVLQIYLTLVDPSPNALAASDTARRPLRVLDITTNKKKEL